MIKKFLLIIIFFLIPSISFGAVLYFNQSKQDGLIRVDLLLNRQGKNINAIEGEFLFDHSIISIKDIIYGNSPVTFWVEKPNEFKDGVIRFSGIIPNGLFNGEEAILSVLFFSNSKGQTDLNLKNVLLFENDGKATSIPVSLKPITLSLSETEQDYYLDDNIPPDDFNILLSTSTAIFDGKYFISFLAQDKGSGISKYEIKEGFWGDFKEGMSPYLLENQSLKKKIYVRAYDKNGNMRISEFDAVYPLLSYKDIILIVIIFIIIYGLWKIKKNIS